MYIYDNVLIHIGRFRNYSEEDRKTAIMPITGYTGDFLGKVEGKVGRIEVGEFIF